MSALPLKADMLSVGRKLRAFVVKSSDGKRDLISDGVKHFHTGAVSNARCGGPFKPLRSGCLRGQAANDACLPEVIAKGLAAHCYADMASSKCCVLPLVAVHRIGK